MICRHKVCSEQNNGDHRMYSKIMYTIRARFLYGDLVFSPSVNCNVVVLPQFCFFSWALVCYFHGSSSIFRE
jgi:hypothetical protein